MFSLMEIAYCIVLLRFVLILLYVYGLISMREERRRNPHRQISVSKFQDNEKVKNSRYECKQYLPKRKYKKCFNQYSTINEKLYYIVMFKVIYSNIFSISLLNILNKIFWIKDLIVTYIHRE